MPPKPPVQPRPLGPPIAPCACGDAATPSRCKNSKGTREASGASPSAPAASSWFPALLTARSASGRPSRRAAWPCWLGSVGSWQLAVRIPDPCLWSLKPDPVVSCQLSVVSCQSESLVQSPNSSFRIPLPDSCLLPPSLTTLPISRPFVRLFASFRGLPSLRPTKLFQKKRRKFSQKSLLVRSSL